MGNNIEEMDRYGESTDVSTLESGTKFKVINGSWNGQIIKNEDGVFLNFLDKYFQNIDDYSPKKIEGPYYLVIDIQEKGFKESKGVYKHYKGGIYYVFDFAKHTEDEIELVIYSDEQKRVWARPKDMFFGYVTLDDGREVQRFKRIR